MPQRKSPDLLYHIGLSRTRQWLLSVASTIYEEYGAYDLEECQQAVKHFNLFLTSSVPFQIIDDLYNSTKILLEPDISSEDQQLEFDPRIALSIYIHSYMKTVMTHRLVNDTFWKSTLVSLKHIISLNLYKVCTDEILKVVGNNCLKLECINIVSKSCLTRIKDRHNALKLQLCVSDVGLRALSNCVELKEIQMTSVIRKGCGGRKMTNEGIKQLLLSLPKLQRINYTDTGMLLDSLNVENDKLSLISVTDYHPCAARIPKLELLCPNLTELHLTHGFSSSLCRTEVICALSKSGLRLSVLSLTNFTFDEHLKSCLKLKGRYLEVFNFESNLTESVDELIILLGRECIKLEHLCLHFQSFDKKIVINQSTFSEILWNNQILFRNLKSLDLKGMYWDSGILLALLKRAISIQKIVLSRHIDSGCLDNVLRQIKISNPFTHLENVSFSKCANVSFQFLKDFLFECPVLKNISIECDSPHINHIEQLQLELFNDNYDVDITVYVTP